MATRNGRRAGCSRIRSMFTFLIAAAAFSRPGSCCQTMADAAKTQLKATIDAIRNEHILGKNVRKVGTIGYCFGGGYSLQAALVGGPEVNACVMYYGYPETDPQKLVPLRATVLGNFANLDTS